MLNTLRTPKAGEHWVWKECDKHRFKQLRDLVVIGIDHEDQPQVIQEMQLEHIRCGCQFPADDAAAALRDLRADEKRQEWEMRKKMTEILYRSRQESSSNIPWLLIGILWVMAVLMYWVLHR